MKFLFKHLYFTLFLFLDIKINFYNDIYLLKLMILFLVFLINVKLKKKLFIDY